MTKNVEGQSSQSLANGIYLPEPITLALSGQFVVCCIWYCDTVLASRCFTMSRKNYSGLRRDGNIAKP